MIFDNKTMYLLTEIIENHFNFNLTTKQEKIFCKIYDILECYIEIYKRIDPKFHDERILLSYDNELIHCVKENCNNLTIRFYQNQIFKYIDKYNKIKDQDCSEKI